MRENSEKNNLKKSYKQFGILLKISLIIGIIIVSGFIIYYILTPEPGYVTLGILNEYKKAEDYPTRAAVNDTISFYVTVENHLNQDFSFQVQVKRGNKDTQMTPNVPTNGSLDLIVGNFTLSNGGDWISEKLNISFSQIGNNQIIITELWQIKNNIPEFYTKLWVRLNITN
ncbi:hypothetical protein LCGC14_2186540 [marine sediment metagenome]|uniref:DUF1616 domain-containing protein n=1 Tax=marine sediment metagenome TaxID=412755 RepID=A0A0F9DKT6_9ZZZZ